MEVAAHPNLFLSFVARAQPEPAEGFGQVLDLFLCMTLSQLDYLQHRLPLLSEMPLDVFCYLPASWMAAVTYPGAVGLVIMP